MSKEKQIEIRGWASSHPRAADDFLKRVVEAVQDGYVMHPKPTTIRQRPNLVGFPSVTMVTKEYAKEIMDGIADTAVEAPKEAVEAVVEETNTNVAVAEESSSDANVEALKAKIDALSGKDQMFAFAKEHGLEIPQDKKVPKAIQKWLLEQLYK